MKNRVLLIIVIFIYIILGNYFHFYIPCFIHEIFGIYCPGCGITRMLLSIIKLDFIGAFRYNPLLFILLPFGLYLFIDNIYSIYKNKEPIYKKINNKVWIILIIILIIYGILRNIYVPLAPTKIH